MTWNTKIRILECIEVLSVVVAVLVVSATIFFAAVGIKYISHKCPSPKTETIIERQPLSGWDILTLAIIKTESEFDSLAVNDDQRGILQIRPIYVEDCNRILGIERFSHDDAFSVRGSLEMFSIIQEHYNPTHDIDRAIELHNPTASVAYREKVLWNFKKLVRQSEIINQLN